MTVRAVPCLPFTRLWFRSTGYRLLTSSRRGNLEYAHLYRQKNSWLMELWISWRAVPTGPQEEKHG